MYNILTNSHLILLYVHAENVKDECVSCREKAQTYCAVGNGSYCNTYNEQ